MSDLIIEECEFWFVWTKNGRVPRFLHHTHAAAEAEADRLATETPGKKFIVLRAYRKVHTVKPIEGAPSQIIETSQIVGTA